MRNEYEVLIEMPGEMVPVKIHKLSSKIFRKYETELIVLIN